MVNLESDCPIKTFRMFDIKHNMHFLRTAVFAVGCRLFMYEVLIFDHVVSFPRWQTWRMAKGRSVNSWLFFYWLWSKILRKWCLFFTDDCVIWMQTNLWCMISIQKTRKTRIRRLARALNPRSRMFLRSVISECCVSLEC